MAATDQSSDDTVYQKRAVEIAIRVFAIFVLVGWCFQIVRPFVVPLVWGIIIAIASYPGYRWLLSGLGDRRAVASSLFAVAMLILLVGPMVMLAETLVDGARVVAEDLSGGTLTIPPPPESVRDWAIIGEPLHRFWALASEDMTAALNKIAPQIKSIGRALLSIATGAGFGVLKFAFAIVLASILLAHAGGGRNASYAIATRLMGGRGPHYVELAKSTVRSVARGILGVALIQSVLAGFGFLAVDFPGAGLLALLCLFLAVIQIGIFPILIPAVIYVFSTMDTTTALLFLVWSIFVGLIDNILKPFLLGRGVQVPMVVIFVGAIGGLLTSGLIGLFVGPVVLALGYTLFLAWLDEQPHAHSAQSGQDVSPAGDATSP